jgi:BASS family bile acid:Na+ symporter
MSISLTACSTVLSVAATPFLTWLYAGQTVPVPAASMFISILKIVLVPVTAGVVLNTMAGRRLRVLKQLLPLLSVASIVFIIGIVVALNRDTMGNAGPVAAAAVVLHNVSGLVAGFLVPMLAGWDRRTCRTIAIEVGMQNSGLAVALALKYFSAAAALPGAVFSLWHNLSGSMLASWWSRRPD